MQEKIDDRLTPMMCDVIQNAVQEFRFRNTGAHEFNGIVHLVVPQAPKCPTDVCKRVLQVSDERPTLEIPGSPHVLPLFAPKRCGHHEIRICDMRELLSKRPDIGRWPEVEVLRWHSTQHREGVVARPIPPDLKLPDESATRAGGLAQAGHSRE